MTDLATAYRGVRARVRAMVVDHSAEADIVSGNLAGAGTDPWTAAQVAARQDREIVELLDGPTATAVRVTRFEFTRAATGRRSPEQIAAYEWAIERDGLARPDLLVATPFTPRLAALVE